MAEMIFLEDHFRCQATRLAGLNEPEESKVGFFLPEWHRLHRFTKSLIPRWVS